MADVPDFDARYRADPDPWQLASSCCERRKLAIVLASLTRATTTQPVRFPRGLRP